MALDTSVLISAQITTSGTCADVVRISLHSHRLCLSDYILDEFQRKLVEKFDYPPARAKSFATALRLSSVMVEPAPVGPAVCRDPADAAILGTALAAKADMLVSVDKDLLDLQSHGGIDIVNPREFFRRTHT